ncbi:MAG TPA: hypothetical protein VJJ98_09435 [Sedimentisphaerales bacterium]|nr:hypothetical protein [Sedimentisphaerales bacterium]
MVPHQDSTGVAGFDGKWKKNIFKKTRKELALCQLDGKIDVSFGIFGEKANYEAGDCSDCACIHWFALRNGILKETGQ